MDRQVLLNIRKLSLDFEQDSRRLPALKGIDLTLHKGEILAIVGESGSGKSVTSLSIMGLLPEQTSIYSPDSAIEFYDKGRMIDLLTADETTLAQIRGNRIAMIFQEPMTSLNPVLTCGEQVMEAILQHQKLDAIAAKTATIHLFEQVLLPNPQAIFSRYPHQLSGGQKQRVMIAMAMSCQPDILICDEPTTALDVTVQKTILELLKQLQQAYQIGIVFITHDLNLVADFADTVAVLYQGQLVEKGPVSTIFKQAQHPYTRALLACRPALYSKGERLPVVADFLHGDTIETQKTKADVQITKKDSTKLLQIHDLHVWYPTNHNLLGKPVDYYKAVNGVSFDVFKGETLGLVGESGCGKSTLGRALLGLIKSHSGKIQYQDKELTTCNQKEWQLLRKDMQLIFQDPYASLNPSLTIGEAIAEPLEVHKVYTNHATRKAAVIELLEKVQLKADHYNRYPHQFSGGQRQRIVIARALALQPSFVICDESVSALDVSVQAQVLNLLNELKDSFGFTAIFISHDLSVVRYISDRIMVMQGGRIVESGYANEVYTNPQSAYTQQLIAAIPKGIVSV